jgi:hypothetical protein
VVEIGKLQNQFVAENYDENPPQLLLQQAPYPQSCRFHSDCSLISERRCRA